MKNLKKAELTVIALTLLCLFFTAGYFVGRGTTVKVISFEKRALAPAITLVSPSTESAAESTAAAASVSVLDASDTLPNPSPEIIPDTASPSGAAQPDAEKININTSSQARLEELPGIGPVLARSIISYREKHGGFSSIEQILDVDGIGEKKFAAMKEIITIGKG